MEPKMPQMGSGMAQGAAEVMALMPIYQREKIEAMSQGAPFPEFQEWAMQYNAQNAPKIMPVGGGYGV